MDRLFRIVRENLPAYVDRILEIENLSFSSPWSLSDFKTELDKPITHLWALNSGCRIEGYICFWLFSNEIHVTNLAIHPSMRGNHLGKFIMSRIIKAGGQKGIKSIRLEVRPSNIIARKLYGNLGFNEIGRSPCYYRETNEDAILMSLEVSGLKESMN